MLEGDSLNAIREINKLELCLWDWETVIEDIKCKAHDFMVCSFHSVMRLNVGELSSKFYL